jgi:hypothetical protein
LRKNA